MPSPLFENDTLFLFSSVRKRIFPNKTGVYSYRIPVHLFCFITKGEGVALIDGALFKIRPFELYLLVPGMIVEFPEQGKGYEYLGVFFEPVSLVKTNGARSVKQTSSSTGTLFPGHLPIRHPQQVFQRILQMQDKSSGPQKESRFSLRLRLETLINEFIVNASDKSDMSDERIDRSISHMELRYTEKISMEELADKANMGPAAYSRQFRKVTGISPVEYLGNIRIDRAKRLLDQDSSRVKEVAAAVGFRSEFYFSRTFQRIVGVSPTVFMKRSTLKIAVASSLGFQDHLVPLGIDPVCVVDLFHYPGLAEEQYAELLQRQLEELRTSDPDLILADHYHMDFKMTLKEIAHPVFLDFSVWDWKGSFMKIAELVDREREAEQTLTRLELRIAEAKQQLRLALGEERIAIMQVSHRAVGIQGLSGHPLNELIYSELALKSGAKEAGSMWRLEILPESLPELETEHLFVQKHHVLAGSEKIFEELTRSPAWSEIPAVCKRNVKLIPNWFAMSWTTKGRLAIIDSLVDMIVTQRNT
ncbi:AraC family transcriptional regulator [Cohnella herbarum]|uniref:AraC family transcriptional regulator n=1 Tax=Cohnella herbarum TaxID=2728023 RepID=A0A7Z2ZLE5_9BACL|nr:helix-turn-helix domain-containing protein [Cohnella herbarum]QJD82972.1 AraC family transcriptional regulator [Cohnella herbarum]